jgi:hypothetical protein
VSRHTPDLWPLSVLEKRLPINKKLAVSPFDPEIANDLLINTTIPALSMNERFDILNGTESRTFNIYRFEKKLVLCLGLAIPGLVLGFIALHVHNNGVSAITGGHKM